MTTGKTKEAEDATLNKEGQELKDMAEVAQEKVGEIVEMLNHFYRHKLAAEAHKAALGSESRGLRKHHKKLMKGVKTYPKNQKKENK